MVQRGLLEASNNSIQSPSPSWLLPGGENPLTPVFTKGPPDMVVYLPLVGSNHLALAGAFMFAMLTVISLNVGTYATTKEPSSVLEAVQ